MRTANATTITNIFLLLKKIPITLIKICTDLGTLWKDPPSSSLYLKISLEMKRTVLLSDSQWVTSNQALKNSILMRVSPLSWWIKSARSKGRNQEGMFPLSSAKYDLFLLCNASKIGKISPFLNSSVPRYHPPPATHWDRVEKIRKYRRIWGKVGGGTPWAWDGRSKT